MTGVPGVDHPEEQSEVDVTVTDRAVSVSARVELVDDRVLVVRPSVGEFAEPEVVRPGDAAEVFWRTPEEQRAVPVEVDDAETGPVVRWRLRMTGPAERGQRRAAVRARLRLEVEVGIGSDEYTGQTVDLSEAGMRVQLEGFGPPPEPGARLDVVLGLEDGAMRAEAQVVRARDRGARWLLWVEFVGLPEKDGDRLRRRVFRALREERARAAADRGSP